LYCAKANKGNAPWRKEFPWSVCHFAGHGAFSKVGCYSALRQIHPLFGYLPYDLSIKFHIMLYNTDWRLSPNILDTRGLIVSFRRHFLEYSSYITLIVILIAAVSWFWYVGNKHIHQSSVPQAVIEENPTPDINIPNISTIDYPTPISTLTPTPTPTLTPTSTPTSTSTSTPAPIATPSGLSPTASNQGWKQIFAEDFKTDVPVGSFPGKVYGNEFTVYPDGTKDTAGQQGAPSRYYPSKVASVSNGMLNLYLHTENGTPMGAAILPVLPGNHLYGKYTIHFRSDALSGFKVAWLLWPDSENWPHDGEMDFPESSLNDTINAFMHYKGGTSGSDQDAYTTKTTYTSWHTTSIEWSPQKVNFILDGQLIGTSTAHIPDTAMHWVIQTEACLPSCPASSTAGNVQIDWLAAYSPA
jgi:hypothetical protein